MRRKNYKFCAEVVDDQEIAFENMLLQFICRLFPAASESRISEKLKQPEGRKVDNRMRTFKQFLCNAVGKEGFPESCIPIQKNVFKMYVEFFDKAAAFPAGALRRLKRCQTCHRIKDAVGIIVERKMGEVFCFQDFAQV